MTRTQEAFRRASRMLKQAEIELKLADTDYKCVKAMNEICRLRQLKTKLACEI